MTIQNKALNEHSPQRFVDAQNQCYKQVIKELSQGRKASHWIWFIFPQVYGLGFSQYSKYFGIHVLAEAKAYWGNALLRRRYTECLPNKNILENTIRTACSGSHSPHT